MPFVQTTRERIEKNGPEVLNLTLDFDEMTVLELNRSYLESTLDVCISNIPSHYLMLY